MNPVSLGLALAEPSGHHQARLLHEAFWRSVRHAVRPPQAAAGKLVLKPTARRPTAATALPAARVSAAV